MSKIHKIKCGNTERWSFSKIKPILDMPYLIEVQKDSYKYLVEKGLKEVFDDFSPITDYSGKLELEFIDYTLDGDCKYSVKQCKERDKTYTSPLRVTVRLTIKETGKAIENTVFMGDFPKMTDRGTFIINGAERVVVSQLVRSPGVYTAEEKDRNGVARYNTTVIPNRGAWLEFEQDNNNVLSVRVDKTRKITSTMLLRALGFGTNERLVEIFGQDEMLEATMSKDAAVQTVDEAKIEVYRKLKPGEIPTANGVDVLLTNLLFDSRRYDISRVGRYNFNKKLSVAERTEGRTLARDVEFEGEIIAEKGEVLTAEKSKEIQNLGINEVYIVTPNGGEYKVIGNNTVDLAFYIHSNPRDLGIMEKVYFPVLKPILDEYGTDVEALKIACKENADILVTKHISIDDIIAAVSYNFGMKYGFCQPDNIDHLSNRRVRMVGELLQNQFRIGIARLERVVRERMSSFQNMDDVTPAKLINIRPVSSAIREFFGSSQLSQFMDQPNPIAELTHKRKLSALGPGGLNRERAGFEVRDVHHSHYGRMCPIETPEGQNIGLITSLSSYAKVNEYGFIEAPYRRVDRTTGFVTDIVDYLTADEEDKHIVAQANEPLTEDNHFVHERVICRHRDLIKEYPAGQVDYMDVDPKQLVSVATSLIPFLENDDANRALMGSNMQRQAVPLLRPEAPIIGTGMEHKVAYDSGVCVVAKNAGVVTKVLADEITVTCDDGERDVYTLQKFERSNQGTCVNQKVIVSHGQRVEKGDVLADGPSVDNGELALGRNILIGFMTWEGYNYEDAILISEDLVKKDVFTSIHIEEHQIESRDIKFGEEQITRDIPNVSEDLLKNLDEDGIVRIGAEVNSGDYLVGKVTPKGETELTPEERLLKAIFGEKSREVRDVSLKVPHGEGGIVVDVKVMSRENKDELEPGVNKLVRVYIAQKRKIGVGDKMAGRHGNKGVISRVLPREDMPFLPDGTPLQIVLNPLGVPSRMNIGQVLEVHLGLVSKLLGYKIATPVFDGAKEDDISELFKQNNLPLNGKMEVYDGRTGEKFENPVTVGYMYMLKLNHLVDDKIHARSIGPYSLVTQQPLGGKAQRGGQRFGEMEVWALEAYGAANILQEMLTVKSDDVLGRQSVFDSIIKNTVAATPGIPESFKVLQKEMQSLCLDVNLLSDNQESIKITETYDEDKDEYAGVVARDDHKALETDMFDLFGSHDTILDDDDDSPLFGKNNEKGIDSLGDLDSIMDDDLLGYGSENPLDDDKDTDLFDMEVGDSEAALLEEFDNNDDDNI